MNNAIKLLADQALSSIGLRLTHRRCMPKSTDKWLYEPVLQYIQARKLGSPVILDVGANIGQTAQAYRRSFPTALIHSFEPVPSTFEVLVRNIGDRHGHVCHCFGLSDLAGERLIQLQESSLGNRVDCLSDESSESALTAKIRLKTLDDFVAEAAISHISVLKCDAEGHDLHVLNGGRETLSSGMVGTVLVEATLGSLSPAHVSLVAFEQQLEPFGFKLFGLYDIAYRKSGRLKFCNALFYHNSVSHPG